MRFGGHVEKSEKWEPMSFIAILKASDLQTEFDYSSQ